MRKEFQITVHATSAASLLGCKHSRSRTNKGWHMKTAPTRTWTAARPRTRTSRSTLDDRNPQQKPPDSSPQQAYLYKHKPRKDQRIFHKNSDQLQVDTECLVCVQQKNGTKLYACKVEKSLHRSDAQAKDQASVLVRIRT